MESTAAINQAQTGNVSGHYTESGRVEGGAPVKIRFAYKALAFCFATVTLSWFFEGTRQCKDSLSLEGLAYLVGGTLLTLFFVAMMGFFIYCEERSKGKRTRNIALFDKWYLHLVSKQKGDYTNRG